MPKRPDLSLPLAQPITLTRGPRSHLVTLMDAAIPNHQYAKGELI
jgi:hypothetical protein